MKAGLGEDHFSIAWQYPNKPREVIPAKFSQTKNPFEVGAILDTWTGVSGDTIQHLLNSTKYLARNPDKSVRLLDFLESRTDTGDNYGIRMSGWLVPPVTGDYVFWIASDNHGEFWLSSSDDRRNMFRICRQSSWTQSREWDKSPEQQSRSVSLVAGNAYYYVVRLLRTNRIMCIGILFRHYCLTYSTSGADERGNRRRQLVHCLAVSQQAKRSHSCKVFPNQ